MAFQVYKMGCKILAQLVSILWVKLKDVVIRGKKIFFLISGYFFSKCTIFVFVTFFSPLVVIQSTQFFSVSTYLWNVFDEAFFLLTIRIPMVTKLFRVVHAARSSHPYKYAWHLNGVVLLGHVANKIYLHLQKIYRHHSSQGANIVL